MNLLPKPTLMRDLQLDEYVEEGEKGVVVLVSISLTKIRKNKWLDLALEDGMNYTPVSLGVFRFPKTFPTN
ncbi:hypothetical protein [Melghirimyces algeriensis]|uniref:hypothetical protein n=1 Tax=Melghirimyces algeriensis TaxID=910412 RepID=UPI00163D5F03|nr:hypothetical protein [Melghirimyces algeriensis]